MSQVASHSQLEARFERAEKLVRYRFKCTWRDIEVTQVGERGFYIKVPGKDIPIFQSWEEYGGW